MPRFAVAVLSLFALVCAAERGAAQAPDLQERVAKRKAAFKEVEDKWAKVLQRTIDFVEGEKKSVRLFKVDPELIEQKFMASVRLRLPSRRHLQGLALLHSSTSIEAVVTPSTATKEVTVSAQFEALSEHLPKEHAISETTLKFLTSETADRDVQITNGPTGETIYSVYAPTAEVAEDRVNAIMALMDAGLRSLQTRAIEQAREQINQWDGLQKQISELEKQIVAEREKLAQPSELTKEVVDSLIVQKIASEVKIAGLSARIKLCEDKLKAEKISPQTQETLRDAQVRAEIELAGLEEELVRIKMLVRAGLDRQAMQQNVSRLLSDLQAHQHRVEQSLRSIASLAEAAEEFAPPHLGDKVAISPIEWVR
jgi:hypothetical protein